MRVVTWPGEGMSLGRGEGGRFCGRASFFGQKQPKLASDRVLSDPQQPFSQLASIVSVPVFTDTASVFTDTVPVFTSTVPVFTNTVSVFTNTVYVLTDTVSVFTDTVPVFTNTASMFTDTGILLISKMVKNRQLEMKCPIVGRFYSFNRCHRIGSHLPPRHKGTKVETNFADPNG